MIYGKWLRQRSFKRKISKFVALWVLAVHIGVDRHQEMSTYRWSQVRTDRHIQSSINWHHLLSQLDRARQWGSWPTKSSWINTLIHPSPTVWPHTRSISANSQSPIDSRSQATIDMSSPEAIDTRLSPTKCGYLASMWPDRMHSDTHLNFQRHRQTSTTSNLRM